MQIVWNMNTLFGQSAEFLVIPAVGLDIIHARLGVNLLAFTGYKNGICHVFSCVQLLLFCVLWYIRRGDSGLGL